MKEAVSYLRTALQLKLGLANPYRIAAQHSLLSSEASKTIQATFLQKQKINRNTYLLRLALPDPDKCLGLMIGQFIRINMKGNSRPYIPISRIDEPGIVDLFVRDMRPENKVKSFTNHLLELKEGEKVELQGPRTQYLYHGYGKLEWQGSPLKTYKHIGIIAYQSGITGVYNLIDSIMPNYDNNTGISLLWIGQELDDFVFLEEFSMLAEQQRLNFNLMLRETKPGWIGPYGRINKSHIQSFMPPPTPQTALLLVGGPDEIDHLMPITKQMGYEHVMEPLQNS